MNAIGADELEWEQTYINDEDVEYIKPEDDLINVVIEFEIINKVVYH